MGVNRRNRGQAAAFSAVALLAGWLSSSSGCLYDSSERCGEAMRYDADRKVCVCEENAIIVTGGCHACAADEVAAGNACVKP